MIKREKKLDGWFVHLLRDNQEGERVVIFQHLCDLNVVTVNAERSFLNFFLQTTKCGVGGEQ